MCDVCLPGMGADTDPALPSVHDFEADVAAERAAAARQSRADDATRARGGYVPDNTTRLAASLAGFALHGVGELVPLRRLTWRLAPTRPTTAAEVGDLLATLDGPDAWEALERDGAVYVRATAGNAIHALTRPLQQP